MRIDNPRFRPEDIFTEKYWCETRQPTEGYRASRAPRSERKELRHLFGEVLLPILQGRIRGTQLPEGAIYDPPDPDLTDLPQHFPGTVLLTDRERIHRREPNDAMISSKTLPLDEVDELALHLPSRQFIKADQEYGITKHSRFLHIQHNDMEYVRSVRIEAIALQVKTRAPVAYTPMPFPIDETRSVPIQRLNYGPVGRRIGESYAGNNGGIWRTTMIEICQQGEPAEVPIQSIASLGKLATEQ